MASLKRLRKGITSASLRLVKRELPEPIRKTLAAGRTGVRLVRAKSNKQRLGIGLVKSGRRLRG